MNINIFMRKVIETLLQLNFFRNRVFVQNKFILENKKINKIIREKYSDCYCVFTPYGLGDIFFTASLIKEFKKTHSGEFVYFIEKNGLKNFAESFPSIDEVVVFENLFFLRCFQWMQKTLTKGCLHFLSFPYNGVEEAITFADCYNNLLDVPVNAQRELPVLSNQNNINAQKEFERLNITPSKTIIIIPEATMFNYKVISPKFWTDFADCLIKQGYDVVFNSNSKFYKNYKTTFLSILDFISFAKNVKHIYSFRSGICDVLVGMNISNLTAIYPYNMEILWADKYRFQMINANFKKTHPNEFDNIFNIYSLNKIFHRDDIKEILYNYDDKEFMEQLILHLK